MGANNLKARQSYLNIDDVSFLMILMEEAFLIILLSEIKQVIPNMFEG
jgi:hypothetical protein